MKAYITQKKGKKYWQELDISPLTPNYGGGKLNVVVDTNQRFQKFRGFGGAVTDSCWCAVKVLPTSEQEKIIDALFSPSGLDYNMTRVPMHTTDFSPFSKTYIDEYDDELKTFDISWDKERLDFYLRCNAKKNGQLFTMLSVWSPPAFMKDNNSLFKGGKLLDKYKKAWAEYFCRFIEEAGKMGIKFDCLSTQNEPDAVQTWESCIYSAQDEALFIRDFLHPALVKHGYGDIKIAIWDHNRDIIIQRCLDSFAIDGVRDLVWGIAYHWYCSEKSENLSTIHALFPEKEIFLSECCVELAYDSTTGKASVSGLWEHGERYARHIINDFNNYSQAWIDWNMCLDEQGGPNHVGNFCEAPIMIDKNTKTVHYMNSYYYIGHFSKFIHEGATRVYCANDAVKNIYSTAFVNTNGEVVTVILNTSNRYREVTLTIDGQGTSLTLPPHSILTTIK